MVLHWGLVSSGKIVNDFVTSLKALPSDKHIVVAVGARSLENAKNFAKTHDIPKYYEGYNAIALDKDIDIAYVGTVHPQHYKVVKLMLEHGKHVLCEKPLTMNEQQTCQLIELAQKKKLFLMEAIWSRCFPIYNKLDKLLKENAVGEVIQVISSLGANLQHVDRIKQKELGGGTILDLGIYTLQFQQFVFKNRQPKDILVNGYLNEHCTDDSMNAILDYGNGKTAIVSTSSKVQLCNEGIIIGTKGIIRIPNMWCPTEMSTPDNNYKFDLPMNLLHFNFYNSIGLSYEAEHVRECIEKGLTESPKVPLKDTLYLAQMMDILKKKLGVVYNEDL